MVQSSSSQAFSRGISTTELIGSTTKDLGCWSAAILDEAMASDRELSSSNGRSPDSSDEGLLDPLPKIQTPRLEVTSPISGGKNDDKDDTPPLNGHINGLGSPGRGSSSRTSSIGELQSSTMSYDAPKIPSNMSPRSRVFDIQRPQRLSSAMSAMSSRLLEDSSRISSSSLLIEKGLMDSDGPMIPWEIIRWTQLREISGSTYNQYGRLTCMTVRWSSAGFWHV